MSMDDFDVETEAVSIDPASLQEEFVAFPGTLSRWGALYADAISAAAYTEEDLTDTEAEVYLELRLGAKHTEAELKALVRTDRRVRLKRSIAMAAEAKKIRFREKIISALHFKKDMIISLGAHQRAELGGDPLVRRGVREERTAAELELLVEQRMRGE